MVKKRSPAKAAGDLRVRAEKVLAARGTSRQPVLPDDVREVVHELQVHQIELEAQNEELRRAQETITESRNRYADLYDLAPVGYVTLDPQGLIVDLNRKGARLLGAPRNSLIQKPFFLFVAPEDRQTFHAYLRQLSVGAPDQSCELEFNPLQAPAEALSLEGLARVEAGGKVIQYRLAITDITRRRQAEADLRRSEEKFRRLYEKAPLGYQSLDEDGIIREVNQTWLDLLGYSRQEVIGRWFGDFLPPGSLETFLEKFAAIKGSGEVCNLDFELMRKDGARISVSFSGRVALRRAGRILPDPLHVPGFDGPQAGGGGLANRGGAFAAQAGLHSLSGRRNQRRGVKQHSRYPGDSIPDGGLQQTDGHDLGNSRSQGERPGRHRLARHLHPIPPGPSTRRAKLHRKRSLSGPEFAAGRVCRLQMQEPPLGCGHPPVHRRQARRQYLHRSVLLRR